MDKFPIDIMEPIFLLKKVCFYLGFSLDLFDNRKILCKDVYPKINSLYLVVIDGVRIKFLNSVFKVSVYHFK